jgi:hypothetical protein
VSGIAIGPTLSIMNYLLLGWGFEVDGFYMHSFEIWLACMVVFPGLGNVGFTVRFKPGRDIILFSDSPPSLWNTVSANAASGTRS